jgi:hypothetical protein
VDRALVRLVQYLDVAEWALVRFAQYLDAVDWALVRLAQYLDAEECTVVCIAQYRDAVVWVLVRLAQYLLQWIGPWYLRSVRCSGWGPVPSCIRVGPGPGSLCSVP